MNRECAFDKHKHQIQQETRQRVIVSNLTRIKSYPVQSATSPEIGQTRNVDSYTSEGLVAHDLSR
jgi:hypothetical protein